MDTGKSSILNSVKDLTYDITHATLGYLYGKLSNSYFSQYMFYSSEKQDQEKERIQKLFSVDINTFGPCSFDVDLKNFLVLNSDEERVMHTVKLINEFNHIRRYKLRGSESFDLNLQHHLELEDLNPHYKSETHKVVTQDGFVITIFRVYVDDDLMHAHGYFSDDEVDLDELMSDRSKREIKSKKKTKEQTNNYKLDQKQSILIQHGIVDSSDGFLCNTEDKCLPLVLANKGYDVWLSNARGNYYAEEHLYLNKNTESQKYYNYSLDEMGRFDIPAVINYILKARKSNEKLILIGHSQGAASAMAGMSLSNQFFSERVKLFIALAPSCRLNGMTSPIVKLAAKSGVETAFDFLKIHSFGHRSEKLSYLSSKHLNNFNFKLDLHSNREKQSKSLKIGIDFTSFIFGFITDECSQKLNDSNTLTKMISHNPSGVNVKSLLHLKSLITSDSFIRYDYGAEENKRTYGDPDAPEYNLSAITIPTMIIYGKHDRLMDEDDIDYIHSRMLGSVISVTSYESMGHLSYQVGIDAAWINEIVKNCSEYKTK